MKIDETESFSLDGRARNLASCQKYATRLVRVVLGAQYSADLDREKNPPYAFGPKESKNEVKNAFHALPEPENEPIYFHLRSSTIS